MNTFLSHDTALAYWRCHFPLDSELGAAACASIEDGAASRKIDVTCSVPEEFIIPGQPIDVLIFTENHRRKAISVRCHLWKTNIPPDSFHKTRGIYISSPEFTFLQMAAKLSTEQLIALGCELCGFYALLPKGTTHPSALDAMPTRLEPLTNLNKMASFLKGIGKARGKDKAIRALKYIVEGSRSPMETMVYMLLCLPAMLGGYGLPQPEMNAAIKLDDEARLIARRRHCEGDLCWPKVRLDIEYHGEVHVGAAQMKSDVGRELGIEYMGWRVMTLTSSQVLDSDQFEVVAKEAAKHVGKRLPKPSPKSNLQRNALRHELHQWMFDESAKAR